VQYAAPGKKPRSARPVRRKRSSDVPPILYVGVGVVGLLFIGFVLALAGGDDPPARARDTASPPPAHAPAAPARGSAAPAATAAPAPAAAPAEQARPEARPQPAADSELDNEETAEEARERLRLVDEMRAREAKALQELEANTNEEDD
jgi:hypothetical protein